MDAEQAVIGAMLKNRMVIHDVTEILTRSDFYEHDHGVIFQAIVDLDSDGTTPDLIAVSESIKNTNQDISVTYIAKLYSQVATTATVGQHAKIVRENSVLRQLIGKLTRITNQCYDRTFDNLDDFIGNVEADILELNSGKHSEGLIPIKNILLRHIEDMESRKPGLTGIKTPWDDLNYMTNGLQRSDLIILAGRPSMGKSSAGVQLSTSVALDGGNVAIFTIETKKVRIVDKMIMQQARIDGQRMRIGNLTQRDWDATNKIAAKLHKASLYIDDNSSITVADIRSRCRRLKQEVGLDLVMIDYLGFINSSKKSENRNLEIGYMTRGLKGLAKELDVPVVLLAQLNRQVSGRASKVPMLSDLRESGNIEQDADVVIFIHRDEYYNADSEKKGIAEFIIAKQREGPTGIVELGFIKEYTLFLNLAKKSESDVG